ncbi:kinesin-like nuclear fusion protein [Boothiomyces macroporosus]|uniref:Kinesin-like protein n=1 Tax=Boothiomyces macroporosus TaxID=261099 RepID=A0AAD5Y1X4_9FUNG|nr:kinesin-like nuclear fusion protein [Boothiomyces macroporosus]
MSILQNDESGQTVVENKENGNNEQAERGSPVKAVSHIPTKLPGINRAAQPKTVATDEEDFVVHSTGTKRKADDMEEKNLKKGKAAPPKSKITKEPPAGKKVAPRTSRTVTKPPVPRQSVAARPIAAPKTAATKSATASKLSTTTAPPKPPVSKSIAPVQRSGSVGPPPAKKKRAAYDVKGRLQDLEEQHEYTHLQLTESNGLIKIMTDKLEHSQKTISDLLQFKTNLETTVQVKEQEKSIVEKELQSVASVQNEMKEKYENQIKDFEKQVEEYKRKIKELEAELEGARSEISTFKITISQLNAAKFAIENKESDELCKTRLEKIKDLETNNAQLMETIAQMEDKLRKEESIRRALHNTIQELKGNIRVFCRMRPLLGEEITKNDESLCQINFPETENSIELVQYLENAAGNKTNAKTTPFQFDKVFQPTASQAEVFSEISQLVQSALDGYNVCIFAYGQTGSGKTFTMEGPPKVNGIDDPNTGMIPRAVQQIFTHAEELKEKGWEYTMEAQYLEIYNETIRDLLTKDDGSKPHDIKHDHQNDSTHVTNTTNVMVTCPDEVFVLLAKAGSNRAVAATNCNERSSRSHSVFTLKLTGTNPLTEESSCGVLNLVDLAGSERLNSSGSTGERLKETQSINKSLSSLSDVINALGQDQKHIPYRNSKLTYLLQNSLGGNSKTLMFVNISPATASFTETLSSLRFATKVNNCEIGTAKKQK